MSSRRTRRRDPYVFLIAYVVVPVLLLAGCTGVCAAQAEVTINPGHDLFQSVDANPPGTTFLLKAGVHRMQSAAPKDGDTFIGEDGAVLNGSLLLTVFDQTQFGWAAWVDVPPGQVNGQCEAEYPRCMYPEDLYYEDYRLRHVASLQQVGPGSWFFDYDSRRVYMGDDPTGHRIELSTTRNAFHSSAVNVTIRNLVIEKYATPAQMGAIGDDSPGQRWTIKDSEIRFNHGVGVNVSDGSQILRCRIHHNGQLGMRGAGAGILVEGNEISYNNDAHFDATWEAGAFKFLQTNGLIIRNNSSHHNRGHGMWTDVDNFNTLYEQNSVNNNSAAGISHEISFFAIIRNNIIWNNGPPNCDWLWAGQIQIQNSQQVRVENNIVLTSPLGCGHAIGLIEQDRGWGPSGQYLTRDNTITKNLIFKLGDGATGAVADFPHTTLWTGNNIFDRNLYLTSGPDSGVFLWKGETLNWDGFRSNGQEINGALEVFAPGSLAFP
jgi:Right handed beta helix region